MKQNKKKKWFTETLPTHTMPQQTTKQNKVYRFGYQGFHCGPVTWILILSEYKCTFKIVKLWWVKKTVYQEHYKTLGCISARGHQIPWLSLVKQNHHLPYLSSRTISKTCHVDRKLWCNTVSLLCLCVCIAHLAAKRRACGWGTCLFSKPHAELPTGSESCRDEWPEDDSADHRVCDGVPQCCLKTHTSMCI